MKDMYWWFIGFSDVWHVIVIFLGSKNEMFLWIILRNQNSARKSKMSSVIDQQVYQKEVTKPWLYIGERTTRYFSKAFNIEQPSIPFMERIYYIMDFHPWKCL